MRGNIADMTIRGWDNQTGRLKLEPASLTVWFTSPVGTFETYQEAATACERCDMLPELCIRPVPVMVGQNPGVYEVLL
jgi:hypothetical protein